MNTPEPLSPEERELARLLGRPGAHAPGPGAQVETAILTMARTPAEAIGSAPPGPQRKPLSPASGGRRRRRLGASLAVAASLVLVVGLAWQLQPTTPPLPSPVEGVVDMAAPAAAEVAAEAPPSPAASPATVAAPSPASPEALPHSRTRITHAPAQPAAKTAPARTSPHTTAAIHDEAQVMPPPAAPAPPAPPASPMPASDASARRTAAEDMPPRPQFDGPRIIPHHAGQKATEKAAAARRERANVAAAPATAADRATATAGRVVDIEADATLSRRQWLKRIRARRDTGDMEGARASLRRFSIDHPKARIPADLQPLLAD